MGKKYLFISAFLVILYFYVRSEIVYADDKSDSSIWTEAFPSLPYDQGKRSKIYNILQIFGGFIEVELAGGILYLDYKELQWALSLEAEKFAKVRVEALSPGSINPRTGKPLDIYAQRRIIEERDLILERIRGNNGRFVEEIVRSNSNARRGKIFRAAIIDLLFLADGALRPTFTYFYSRDPGTLPVIELSRTAISSLRNRLQTMTTTSP